MGCGASSPAQLPENQVDPEAKRDRRKSINTERDQAKGSEPIQATKKTAQSEPVAKPGKLRATTNKGGPVRNPSKLSIGGSGSTKRKASRSPSQIRDEDRMISMSPTPSSLDAGWDWRAAPEITVKFDAIDPKTGKYCTGPKALGFNVDSTMCVSEVIPDSQADEAGVGVGWKIRWVEMKGRDCTWSVPISTPAEVAKAFAEVRERRNKKIVTVLALDKASAALRYPEDEVFTTEEDPFMTPLDDLSFGATQSSIDAD